MPSRTTSSNGFLSMVSCRTEHWSSRSRCCNWLGISMLLMSVRRLSSLLILTTDESSLTRSWHPSRVALALLWLRWRIGLPVSSPLDLSSRDSRSWYHIIVDYVLQRALAAAEGEQRDALIAKVWPQLISMHRYSSAYSKHLLSSMSSTSSKPSSHWQISSRQAAQQARSRYMNIRCAISDIVH
jgi:hypothetical protein